jgi:peptidoglycan/LPS O-acetylase OafA/YrhL
MFNNIQMLRAVAAAMVFFYHADAHYQALGGGFRSFSAFAGIGFSGVDIFFVISGFVVAHTSLDQARTLNDAWAFARRRLLRIYLGYWPFFALTLVLGYIYTPAAFPELDLLSSFFLTTMEAQRMVLYVSWSLTLELLFYATVTATFALPAKAIKKWVHVCAIGVFLFLVVTFSAPDSFVLVFLSFFFEFLTGVIIYIHRQRMKSRLWIGPLMLAVFVAFATGAYLHATNGSVRILTFGIGALALVALVLVLEQSLTLIANRFWVAAGDASYTLYLVHPALLTVFYWLGMRDFLAGQSVYLRETGFFLCLGLGLWVSRVLYVRIERPLYRWASSAHRSVGILRP